MYVHQVHMHDTHASRYYVVWHRAIATTVSPRIFRSHHLFKWLVRRLQCSKNYAEFAAAVGDAYQMVIDKAELL